MPQPCNFMVGWALRSQSGVEGEGVIIHAEPGSLLASSLTCMAASHLLILLMSSSWLQCHM